MRLLSVYPLAIAILSSPLVFGQGELGAPCTAVADGTSTGSTPTCDSGTFHDNDIRFVCLGADLLSV